MNLPIPSTQRPTLSFEFFPPKTEEGWTDLRATLERTRSLKLDFVSVTYGAGGSTRSRTLEMCRDIQNDLGLSAMAHLTCVGHSRAEIDGILDQLSEASIGTLMALRGDPPKGQTEFVAHPDGFRYAEELIAHIQRRGGFRMGCAFYPEIHPEAANAEADLANLRRKQEAGASFAVSQLFYDVDLYLRFRDRARAVGVTMPLVAGLMPVTNLASAKRFVKSMPADLEAAVASAGDDPAQVAHVGVEQALGMIRRLVSEGVEGVHLYTLNKSGSSPALVDLLRQEGLFLRS
ncbi:MAG: methylenetetrahydrofolate reductase [NAD(P)H] [Fibrobacterota bacterium]|nr:methylenetetrahydrofolate reductase [NAD(P)H] [Fibrobacterota bacterium]QQS06479.1 MAG: methylenetetrahydrofolate reductase [NAD(P)H] [Fibrobacterota bacterium]